MPYESEAQRSFMHINHPTIAKRWDKEYPQHHRLPYHKKDKKKKNLHESILEYTNDMLIENMRWYTQ
jgi:hypothetical protein